MAHDRRQSRLILASTSVFLAGLVAFAGYVFQQERPSAGRSAFAPEGPTSKSGTSLQEPPRSDKAYATLVAGVMVPGGSDPNVT